MKTTCPYCGVGCGVDVKDGTTSGDLSHPANAGRLCIKGATLAATLDDSNRLLVPTVGGKQVAWDQALDTIAEKFSSVIAAHGPDAVAIYGSGQFLTEDYYVANKLMKGFIGSANIDTNSRLCMASTVAGHVRAFGEDVVPGCYDDIDEADLLVLVGSNTAWCHPVLFERALAARAARGTKIIVIDPRRTATAALADLHLPVRPDADVGLFLKLLTAIEERGYVDEAYVALHTQGFAGALRAAHETASDAAELGLTEADLESFLHLFCTTPRCVTLFSQGVNQSTSGTDKVNAIINVHLATGRIGKPGMGPFSLTGQPNAMGGREVGGLANQLAAHLRFDDPVDRALLKSFWSSNRLPRKPGFKAIEMFDAVLSGRIKAIWIAATNPAESLPRSARVRAALEACPFVVVSDCWPTETTRLANVTLPAAGWSEKDGTVTNSERCISRQRAFRTAPGEAKPDWWIFTQVAQRMGFANQFAYTKPADIFREHARLSGYGNNATKLFNIAQHQSISDGDYELLQPFTWGAKRFFADGKFPTPQGLANFAAIIAGTPKKRDASFPFILNTGRLRDQWHTMTRTGFVPTLMESAAAPSFSISDADAAKYALIPGDLVRVTTRHGSEVLPAAISNTQRESEIFAAMHWTQTHNATGNINQLVGPARDPYSGQPASKFEHAAIEKIPAFWHGILQTHKLTQPSGQFYASRVPLAGGMHRFTMAGWKPLSFGGELSDWAARLCG
ncbi:MAG TPA: nitrate reductase, partial [Acidocella sp.]|nr:nitrate reductase [Acidocella sp.]